MVTVYIYISKKKKALKSMIQSKDKQQIVYIMRKNKDGYSIILLYPRIKKKALKSMIRVHVCEK